MKEESIQIIYKSNPVLLDKVVQDIQKALKERLAWLNYAFGRAYKLVENSSDGDKFTYPAAYVGEGEYKSLLPNDSFGNFCWFDIYDPQKVTSTVQSLPQCTFSGAIVFWYNLESIYEDSSQIYSEEIKDEILRALTTPGIISSVGRLVIDDIYERLENIYKGYSLIGESLQNIDKQFFMYPYAGIRIEFTLTTRELCTR